MNETLNYKLPKLLTAITRPTVPLSDSSTVTGATGDSISVKYGAVWARTGTVPKQTRSPVFSFIYVYINYSSRPLAVIRIMAPRRRDGQRKLSSYPLYSTTFILHRISPLYIGDTPKLLQNEYLAEHARRFRDILKGDVLRGVHIHSELSIHEGLGKAGGLEECRWTVLDDEQTWAETQKRQLAHEEGNGTPRAEASALNAAKAKGVLVEIEYEKITYQAILLGDPQPQTPETDDGFIHLPLLLTRMPGALRATFLEYLATTFDTRTSQLKLPTDFLPTVLERFFADLTADQNTPQRSETIKSIVGDVQLTFKFSASIPPLLRSFDLDIPSTDLPLFLSAGQNLLLAKSHPSTSPAHRKRKREAAAPHHSTTEKNVQGPFLTALSSYLASHMALNLSHPGIAISKVACRAFVLGAEGKMKLFQPLHNSTDNHNNNNNDEEIRPPRAAKTALQNLLISIVQGARSKRALLEVSSRNSSYYERQGLEKSSSSSSSSTRSEHVDIDLPPPYELHDSSGVGLR
ncbi:MAG: hypothetical protein M1836_005146 [Candelina mexicana]|nr:MAG: hypothetical protein M1836_005146 [Candelina mexicana]